ncbi:hypothetical protein KM043_017254 [Ampulex compressa]|nr:hypothetical protein KM043_017254 [Ampulex compressa]
MPVAKERSGGVHLLCLRFAHRKRPSSNQQTDQEDAKLPGSSGLCSRRRARKGERRDAGCEGEAGGTRGIAEKRRTDRRLNNGALSLRRTPTFSPGVELFDDQIGTPG